QIYSEFTYETYTISGRVTDEQTGEGLHAMVTFFPMYLKDSINLDPGYVFIETYAETDRSGYYSATVLGGYEYIGYAYAFDCDYYEEYYNNTSNYLEAEPILVENDVTDINFTLVKYANEFYNISGKVINKDSQPVSASVQAYLISMDTTGYYYNWAFPAQTDEEGNFNIFGVIPGDYVLFTFPNEIKYLPGYYVEDEFATEEFLSATTVTVNTENNSNLYTIKLKDLIKIDTGKIVQVIGNIFNNNSEPISGVTVRAMTSEGNSVDWALSKSNGKYSLKNLVQGSFKIVAEKNGYEKFETTISLNENDNEFSKDIILFAKAASVKDQQEVQQVAVYPNPASSTLNVNLDLNSNNTNIQILNAAGNVVFENNYSSINSEKLTINVENLAQGNYYLIIKNQS
ncbi:MAG TPA: carboxypeptidase regulatory-like domain-containing protein, partial [Candidatus Kapabacteria bacterium]|nr:carboxypeptidase regulatory-like domain-containing protein [Candidatus Kapabacteria bacterium]